MRQIFFFCIILISSSSFAQTVSDLNDELKYMAAREMVLSKNIANVDTPNYKPKDIKKKTDPSKTIGLKVTHRGHMQIDQNLDYELIQGEILEIKPNGNAVTAENELAKKNENSIKFNTTSSIIKAVNGMTKTAVRGSD